MVAKEGKVDQEVLMNQVIRLYQPRQNFNEEN